MSTALARSLHTRSHRPWPLPDRPWTMGQTWLDLLFAHRSVAEERLRPPVPGGRGLDTDGHAWIGITAEAELEHERLVPEGVELHAGDVLLHVTRRQAVVVWSTEPVAGAS